MHSLAMSVGNNALVLKEFSINNDGPEYVHIVARKAGLLSWLLALVGIDATTVFRVFADRIEFQEGSLSGQVCTTMPLRSISITTCGYTKPFALIVLAILCVIPGVFFTFGLSLILAVIFFIFYKLNKALMISVVSNSSWPASICFKRSVIEGVKIEYEQAQEVINLVNKLTMEQASK